MRIDILTVFPEMVSAALEHSIIKRARERGIIDIQVVNLRDFTTDRHKTTDDIPYGGGGGMVMKIQPIDRALAALLGENAGAAPETGESSERKRNSAEKEMPAPGVPSIGQDAVTVCPAATKSRPRIALTDPRGERFTQATARQWAQEDRLILICGHYEGVDERVRQHLITDEISIGDFILTGGELPALLIVDALTRLQPGALGDEEAPDKDTFSEDLLEYPHYTRPRLYKGWGVPDILMCGHHAQIERWRRWHQLRATQERRPDLFARANLSPQDYALLESDEPTAPPDSQKHVRSVNRAFAPEPAATEMDTIFEEEEDKNGTGTGDYP